MHVTHVTQPSYAGELNWPSASLPCVAVESFACASPSNPLSAKMSFGFSVGDFIAVGKLIGEITCSLQTIGGARSEY
jgi:hypothetical protein